MSIENGCDYYFSCSNCAHSHCLVVKQRKEIERLKAANKRLKDKNCHDYHCMCLAYVKVGDSWLDLEISTWLDYDGEQIQLTLKDGTVMVVSSINCILYNGTLPKEN